MHALSTLTLLEVWEDGLLQPPAQRAVGLLAAAYPDSSRESLAMQSIGQRDGRLLSLREQLWGPRMSAVAPCPACHERLELQLNTRDLVAGDRPHADGSNLFELEGYAVTFRLPNSEDVAAAAHFASDADSCRELILENCVLTAQLRDAQISAK